MKRLFKKTPAVIVVSLIIILTVALSVFASVAFDFTGDGKVDNEDVVTVMKSITGEETLSDENKTMADFDGNESVDVLDVIALKRYMITVQSISDGWTKGIY